MNILFVIPGDLNQPTGGYRYDRSLIGEWQKSGLNVTVLSLAGDYPLPDQADKLRALEQLEGVEHHDVAIVDGLAGGTHPQMMRKIAEKMRLVALVHHPLCMESGLDGETADELEVSERSGLAYASAVVVTSQRTADTIRNRFDLDPHKIHCVLPGVERRPVRPQVFDGTVHLLCVGSVIERKGHRFLFEALLQLKHLDWELDCVGGVDFQPELHAQLRSFIKLNHLDSRIRFQGAVEEADLDMYFSKSHVFVLPSLFEGYGMAYAEAIVRGLPVIGTTAGAIPQTVPTSCGMLVEPRNVNQLAEALATMITDVEKRNSFHLACVAAAGEFPDWETSAQKFAAVVEGVL